MIKKRLSFVLLSMIFGIYMMSYAFLSYDTHSYSNIISGKHYKLPYTTPIGITLYFSPSHGVFHNNDSVGIWSVKDDTLLIWENMSDYYEFLKKYSDDSTNMPYLKTLCHFESEYPYPYSKYSNLDMYIIKDNGRSLYSIFTSFESPALECSLSAKLKNITYFKLLEGEYKKSNLNNYYLKTKWVSWNDSTLQWPTGLFKTISIVQSNSRSIEYVVVSMDSIYYNVMNPVAFHYPLPQPWLSLAMNWFDSARTGQYDRLALFPADSITTLTIPLDELRYNKKLHTDFMLNEARGYFIALPLDSLERYRYTIAPGDTFPTFPAYPTYNTAFSQKREGRNYPPQNLLSPEL